MRATSTTRLFIRTAIGFLISALSITHVAVSATPTTSPANGEIKSFLDRAAAEIPKLTSPPRTSPQARIRACAYVEVAQAYFKIEENASVQRMIDAALQQYALLPAASKDSDGAAFAIIGILCRTQSLEPAERLVANLKGNLRDLAWSDIADARADAGQIEAALTALGKMSTTARFANLSRRSCYQRIAAAHLRAGNPAAARAFLTEQKMLPDFNLAIAHLIVDNIPAAEALLPQIEPPQQKIKVLKRAANMQRQRKNHAEALRFLDASEILAAGMAPDDRPWTFLSNASSRASMGDKEGARKSLSVAIADFNEEFPTPVSKAMEAIYVATVYAQLGDTKEVLRRVEAIHLPKTEEFTLDNWLSRDLAGKVAVVHARCGDLAAARAALAKRLDNPVDDSDVRAVASAAAAAGKLVDLKQWLNDSNNPDDRFAICLGAALGLIDPDENEREASEHRIPTLNPAGCRSFYPTCITSAVNSASAGEVVN
jgi:hypothetical protein